MNAEGYWQYEHELKACSKGDEHTDECDGLCGTLVADDTLVNLHNEMIEWNRREMVIQGLPTPLQGGPFPGISVEIFEVECRLAGLIKYLDEDSNIFFNKDRASECYREVMLEKLQAIRKTFDDAKAKEGIAVAKTQLFGPNGEIIH